MDISAFTDAKNFPDVNPRITMEIPHHDLKYIILGHPLAIGTVGYVPPRRTEDPEVSYYHTPRELRKTVPNDLWSAVTDEDPQYGYDQKSKHENRRQMRVPRMRICEEEDSRSVPLLSSTEIGRFNREDAAIDVFKFPRPLIPCIEHEFFSSSGALPAVKVAQLEAIPGARPVNHEDEKKFYK